MPGTKQAAYAGRVERVLSPERLREYASHAAEPRWEALARHAWNVSICESFYPVLHHVEVVLRNRVDAVCQAAYPVTRFHHVLSWLDADPSPLHPEHGAAEVSKAKRKHFGVDPRTGALLVPKRPISGGDLVASLDFGFWTGMFGSYYMFQNRHDRRLWPHHLKDVFPYGPRMTHPSAVSRRLNEIRHLRNRIFHHEPIWRRPDLLADRDNVLELIGWMSPETARALRTLDRVPEVLSDGYRRRLRVRIYRESRRG